MLNNQRVFSRTFILIAVLLLIFGVSQSFAAKKKHVQKKKIPAMDSVVVDSVQLPSSLTGRMQAFVSERFPSAKLGVSIRSMRSNWEVADINGDGWFTPASTIKIVTTAASLEYIPKDWSPKTTLKLKGTIKERRFVGDLTIVGGGDPNISGRFFKDALSIPLAMVDSIRSLGIDTLQVRFIADTTHFVGPSIPPSWPLRSLDAWYGARPAALSYNDNVLRVSVFPGKKIKDSVRVEFAPRVNPYVLKIQATTGKKRVNSLSWSRVSGEKDTLIIDGVVGLKAGVTSWAIPVEKPADYFMAALKVALQEKGVFVDTLKNLDSLIVTDSLPKAHDKIMSTHMIMYQRTFTTAPLLSIVHDVNQRSQNLHAELLHRSLGFHFAKEASMQAAFKAQKALLLNMGIADSNFVFADGSGLSADNRVKPSVITDFLVKMAKKPQGKLFVNSLALPGAPGSAIRRLNHLDVSHLVRVKTGFIGAVQGLVGYIGLATGDSIAVAIYLNQYKGSDELARLTLDTLWTWIAKEYNGEYAAMREARLLWHEGDSIKGYPQRLDFFSKKLMGRPYFLGPTGEGALAEFESKPRMNMDVFDCVTYLEHVMALASAKSADSVFSTLQRIRYFGSNPSFATRKHYFVEDWIGRGKEWAQIWRLTGDTVINRTMDKKSFFAKQNIPWEGENPRTEIPFLPYENSLQWAKKWDGEFKVMGVGFMAKFEQICVTHTGFLIMEPGKPVRLRHASQLQKMTYEQDLEEYLISRKGKTPGIVLYELLEGK